MAEEEMASFVVKFLGKPRSENHEIVIGFCETFKSDGSPGRPHPITVYPPFEITMQVRADRAVLWNSVLWGLVDGSVKLISLPYDAFAEKANHDHA
jgi:hypothetical protein